MITSYIEGSDSMVLLFFKKRAVLDISYRSENVNQLQLFGQIAFELVRKILFLKFRHQLSAIVNRFQLFGQIVGEIIFLKFRHQPIPIGIINYATLCCQSHMPKLKRYLKIV